MAFDTCDTTVYQVRTRHGNEQVRELVPGDYRGTLVTDRGTSYEAEELSAVEQHKCLSHLIRNVTEVVEKKTGRAKAFGLPLKGLLQQANQLWRKQREAKYPTTMRTWNGSTRNSPNTCASGAYGTGTINGCWMASDCNTTREEF